MRTETGSCSQNDLWPYALLWASRTPGAVPLFTELCSLFQGCFYKPPFETLFFFCHVLWLELELIFKQSFHFHLLVQDCCFEPGPWWGRAARQHSWFRKVQDHRGRWGQDSLNSLNCREIYTSYWAMEHPTSLTPSACIPHNPQLFVHTSVYTFTLWVVVKASYAALPRAQTAGSERSWY